MCFEGKAKRALKEKLNALKHDLELSSYARSYDISANIIMEILKHSIF